MSGIEMAVCFESIQPLIVILKSNDLDPFFNILQPSQSSWMARIAKWLDSAAAWWTPCAMPMWACNRDLTQIERGNTYDDSDDVCHCMWGFEGVFALPSATMLYTTICDLECIVTGIPHEVGDLMFRIKISKRSRLASKADANQTMDIPANSVESLFEIISMCFF